jgi:predicted ATP-dependent endonuclease of OLD family
MYLTHVEIRNIRSIEHLEMEFPEPAGWHVLIGDNGAGKSSIMQAIALALMGPKEALSLRLQLRGFYGG